MAENMWPHTQLDHAANSLTVNSGSFDFEKKKCDVWIRCFHCRALSAELKSGTFKKCYKMCVCHLIEPKFDHCNKKKVPSSTACRCQCVTELEQCEWTGVFVLLVQRSKSQTWCWDNNAVPSESPTLPSPRKRPSQVVVVFSLSSQSSTLTADIVCLKKHELWWFFVNKNS